MLLQDLLRKYDPAYPLAGIPNVEILGVEEDSRLVRTGDLFIARSGTKTDGARYVADAHARGAVAVVVRQKLPDSPLPQVVIDNPAAASILAHLYHNKPTTKYKVIGVTGTNGKTTTTYLIRHLLHKAGVRCGLVGTVEIDDGKTRREATMTTPGPVELADLMATMRDRNCGAVAMETSSHALDQGRVAGVKFAAAGFTNLTGDHLDYHQTMDAYAAAKAKMFELLDPTGVACVNGDDPHADRMIDGCCAKLCRFSVGGKGDYAASDLSVTSAGTTFTLRTPDGQANVSMQLIGRHNIQNALCAASLVGEVFGLSAEQIAAGLADAAGAPGRLQPVKAGQPFTVLVDYAHTDDALKNVLSALKPLTHGKLRVVFGCGGDRDRSKRPRMAQTAEQLADVIYITSDNPRTEPAQSIVDEIVRGIPANTTKPVVVQVDRRRAIEQALTDAGPEDVVLLAGKGHENYQIIGSTKHHFDDVEEAERILRARA